MFVEWWGWEGRGCGRGLGGGFLEVGVWRVIVLFIEKFFGFGCLEVVLWVSGGLEV